MICGLLWFGGGGGWCCVFSFLFSILLCFNGGGGGDGWLLVVGLSFSGRWLLALDFGYEERRKRVEK